MPSSPIPLVASYRQENRLGRQLETSDLTIVAIQAALKAGEILKRGFGSTYQITAKPGKQNFVTEYDRSSEESIISMIRHHFPHHSILAEESGHSKLSGSEITWFIDPLDGTTNFAHHLPIFTISIAAYQKEVGLCAVILQPMTNELFIAEKGKGAFLNGERLSVSKTANMDETLVGGGVPWGAVDNPTPYMIREERFTRLGVNLRNLGSAALALAYVAAGKLDGFWMEFLYPWDTAAGKLLIEEAGGKVSLYDGTPHLLNQSSNLLATNQIIHSQMVDVLNPSQ